MGMYEVLHKKKHFSKRLTLIVKFSAEELIARIGDEAVDAGRLEIFYHGEWNTVCDDEFGREEAQVACRMLGFNRFVISLCFRNNTCIHFCVAHDIVV